MIDIEEYRLQESMAINSLTSWRSREPYFLPTFEKAGFPGKYESLSRLRQYINTFQEKRFQSYMDEDGGISQEETDVLLSVIFRNLSFQEFAFSGKKQIVPFDTAISALKIFSRISALMPECKKILEIGPDSGFLPQFLHFSEIETYVGIEACEVLYMLQDLQFSYLFGRKFRQCAEGVYSNEILLPKGSRPYPDYYVDEYEIRRDREQYRFLHLPWWKIGKIISENMQFDIVTSNANLTEFSVTALDDYLYLISRCLKKEGIFVVCCFGGGSTPLNIVLQKLAAYKFAPIYYRSATVMIGFFIKEGHSLFQMCYHPNLLQQVEGKVRLVLADTTNTPLIKNYLNKMSQPQKIKLTKEQLFSMIRSKYNHSEV